jgi:hypothetical protein
MLTQIQVQRRRHGGGGFALRGGAGGDLFGGAGQPVADCDTSRAAVIMAQAAVWRSAG